MCIRDRDSGAVPTTKEYHKAARELCDKYGMLLIYDEVVTGFRLGMGGAQSIFGTSPDLTVFGKIIGGGYAGSVSYTHLVWYPRWRSGTGDFVAALRYGRTKIFRNPAGTSSWTT